MSLTPSGINFRRNYTGFHKQRDTKLHSGPQDKELFKHVIYCSGAEKARKELGEKEKEEGEKRLH